MPEPDILEQGRGRRETDKLRLPKKLQENQHELDVKRDKKRSKKLWPVISAIIATITLLFMVATYYGWPPKVKNIPHADKQQTNIKSTTSIQESAPSGEEDGGK